MANIDVRLVSYNQTLTEFKKKQLLNIILIIPKKFKIWRPRLFFFLPLESGKLS